VPPPENSYHTQSSRQPFVMMMQATDFWKLYYLSKRWRLHRSRFRTIHPQRQMRTPVMIIIKVVAPNYTGIGLKLLANPATAICVLSPNSATKIKSRVVRKIPWPDLSSTSSDSLSSCLYKAWRPKVPNITATKPAVITFFWNTQDLERKLGTFMQYYNYYRAHRLWTGTRPMMLAVATNLYTQISATIYGYHIATDFSRLRLPHE